MIFRRHTTPRRAGEDYRALAAETFTTLDIGASRRRRFRRRQPAPQGALPDPELACGGPNLGADQLVARCCCSRATSSAFTCGSTCAVTAASPGGRPVGTLGTSPPGPAPNPPPPATPPPQDQRWDRRQRAPRPAAGRPRSTRTPPHRRVQAESSRDRTGGSPGRLARGPASAPPPRHATAPRSRHWSVAARTRDTPDQQGCAGPGAACSSALPVRPWPARYRTGGRAVDVGRPPIRAAR
jgi:hypothetical protein